MADTQRCFRIVRANAKEWGVDPKRIGIMGFSAGGALVAFKFDEGKPDAADPIDRFSSRTDFTVLVYAGDISPRKGIPFGTWHLRFIEWANDFDYMAKAGEN